MNKSIKKSPFQKWVEKQGSEIEHELCSQARFFIEQTTQERLDDLILDAQWHYVTKHGKNAQKAGYIGELKTTSQDVPQLSMTVYKFKGSESVVFRDTVVSDMWNEYRTSHDQHQSPTTKNNVPVVADVISKYNNAKPASHTNPYFHQKKVSDYPVETTQNIRADGEILLIPMLNEKLDIKSVQLIKPTTLGFKKLYAKGTKKNGLFYPLGENPETAATIVVAGGIATALSLYQAQVSLCVVNAFDDGNITHVIRALKILNPNADVIIAADNDRFSTSKNSGIETAKKVSSELQVTWSYPKFINSTTGTDFNDIHCQNGIDAVLEQYQANLTQPNTVSMPQKPKQTTLAASAKDFIINAALQIKDASAAAFNALKLRNATTKNLFLKQGKLARLSTYKDKRGQSHCHIPLMTLSVLKYELERAAKYCDIKDGEIYKVKAIPLSICDDILSAPGYEGIPELERIVNSPIVTSDGRVIATPGYDESSGIYYHQDFPLAIQDCTPTKNNLDWAKDLLLNQFLTDFPFKSQSDRDNLLGLFVLPFARELIDGPTPLHLISAPTQGTGKSLLGELITQIFNPSQSISTAPKDLSAEAEWRKIITTKLSNQDSHIFFDNVTGRLTSPSLAAAMTSRLWSDRLLGKNESVTVINMATWLMTGNNLSLDDDLTRRVLEIRLDSECENPFDRNDFQHTDLRYWTKSHRADLIRAALILIENWIRLEKPKPQHTPIMGSFEHYSQVIGGILESAGFTHFLQNKQETASRANSSQMLWKGFFEAWYDNFGDSLQKPKDLYPIAKECGLFDEFLVAANERGEIIKLGRKLKGLQDKVFSGFKLVFSPVRKNSVYKLISQETKKVSKETNKVVSGGMSNLDKDVIPPKQPIESTDESALGGIKGYSSKVINENEEKKESSIHAHTHTHTRIELKRIPLYTPTPKNEVNTTIYQGGITKTHIPTIPPIPPKTHIYPLDKETETEMTELLMQLEAAHRFEIRQQFLTKFQSDSEGAWAWLVDIVVQETSTSTNALQKKLADDEKLSDALQKQLAADDKLSADDKRYLSEMLPQGIKAENRLAVLAEFLKRFAAAKGNRKAEDRMAWAWLDECFKQDVLSEAKITK